MAKRPLTIYKLKDSVLTFGELRFLVGLEHYSFQLSGVESAALYVLEPRRTPPPWIAFFEQTEIPLEHLYNSYSAAILAIDTGEWKYLLCFGRHIASKIDKTKVISDFGLKIVLNSVDRERIQSLDSLSIDENALLSRIQASRPSELTDFGLDIERDLLRAIAGPPAEEALGMWLYGRDSIVCHIDFGLDQLGSFLRELEKRYKGTQYQSYASWIDNIKPVSDRSLADKLDNHVASEIFSGNLSNIWLAIPEIVDWEIVKGFWYEKPRKDLSAHTCFPSIEDFLVEAVSSRKRGDITADYLRRKRLWMLNAQEEAVGDWPIYRCLYAEIDFDQNRYVLIQGDWYQLDRAFVAKVDSDVAKIEKTDLGIQQFRNESEKDYNDSVGADNANSFVSLDRQLIAYGGGRSRIEFCDLFDGKRIVHVKVYGGSSVLSHLFSQGLVSGFSFVSDPEFLDLLNDKIEDLGLARIESAKPQNFEIIFVILGRKEVPSDLPFFSKVVLLSCHRQLSAYGFKVKIHNFGTTK